MNEEEILKGLLIEMQDVLEIFGHECIENEDFSANDTRGYAQDLLEKVVAAFEKIKNNKK